MLVKFIPKGASKPIRIDSKKIFIEGDYVVLPNTATSIHVSVDDATLAYIENAKLHEGMRRVAICVTKRIYIYNTPSSAWIEQKNGSVRMAEKSGWYFEGKIIDDNGYPYTMFEEIIDDYKKTTFKTNFRFIPYEMEEQK